MNKTTVAFVVLVVVPALVAAVFPLVGIGVAVVFAGLVFWANR